jgi:FkbM family methyltransferase
MESYSQFEQDLHIINNIYNNKQGGYFVDIGAYDGINMSNTYLLEKKYNWKGICVEANPRYFKQLENLRTSINVGNAIYINDNEELEFIDDVNGGCSGFQKRNSHNFLNDCPIIKVKTKNLTKLLEENNAPNFIDYLSIDTEGSEYDILNSHNFDKYKFGYITVEHNFIYTNRMKIRNLLISKGYKFYRENAVDDDYILNFEGIFYNSKKAVCSIYESGLMVYNCLKKSPFYNLTYTEESNFLYNYDFAIVNEHLTVNNWVTEEMINTFNKPVFCIVTEVTYTENYIDKSPNFYTAYIVLDSSIKEKNNVYGFPRPLEDYLIPKYHDNKIPIIGSFGFATAGKNWHKIVEETQNNFEEAIIRFNIPFASYVQDNAEIINEIITKCNSILINPKIKLEITHNNYTKEELINWCAQNSINCFLYDREEFFGSGLCSTTDQAIVSEKPLLVSKDITFRHIHKYIDFYPNISIKEAINKTTYGVKKMKEDWSSKNFFDKFQNILFKYITIENGKENLKNNDKIYTIFGCKIKAYYYISNNQCDADVTNILINLFKKFKSDINKHSFQVNNDIFFNTFPFKIKTLFINIESNNDIITLEYLEYEYVNWFDIILAIENKLSNNLCNSENQIEVSIGEIIDKYSILELKNKYITDNIKLNEITKEINVLENKISKTKKSHFYKQLLYINEQIWLETDMIKKINYDTLSLNNAKSIIDLYDSIFVNNQKRFRLKNYFNILEQSNIKECKSYSDNNCFLLINNKEEIYDKIPEINYLCISYDIVYFDVNYKDIILKIFKNPNIKFIITDSDSTITKIDLSIYKIDDKLRDVFDLNTIIYKSGGKLGDYLNQLSVICEKYYETGQKGELYITDLDYEDSKFLYGVKYTYNDTYNTFINQKYIKSYKIYDNEIFDVDLSNWRNNICFFYDNKYNWINIYSSFYKIKWGTNKWLTSCNNTKWSDKIIINITRYRFMSDNAINKLYEKISDELDNCVFICNENDDYKHFSDKTNLTINCYNPQSFDETLMIINSCKLGFYGFSSIAVMANGLHRPHYLMGYNNPDYLLNNLKDDITYILDIFV